LPLAVLPYLPALALWLAATFAGFATVLRSVAPHSVTLWLALALPAGFINMLHGQNGFLIAALFGGAMLCLDRRPILAGLLIGLLTVKPHLGLLLPIALLAGGRWRAILAAAATALAFAAASAAVLGPESWSAFLANTGTAREQLEDGLLPWSKMHTVFAGARLLGLEVLPAYLLQGLV